MGDEQNGQQAQPQIDWNALAKQSGAVSSTPVSQPDQTAAAAPPTATPSAAPSIDWNALAKQNGAVSSTPVGQASQSPTPEEPSTWDKIKSVGQAIYNTTPPGQAQQGFQNIGDWAAKKTDDIKNQMQLKEASGQPLSAAEKAFMTAEVAGGGMLRDVSRVISAGTSPKGVATILAAAAAPEIVGPYMLIHGSHGLVTGWGDLSNPDVLQNELFSASEIAGGAAATASGGPTSRFVRNKITTNAIAKTAEQAAQSINDLKLAAPPTKSAPYEDADVAAVRPYLQAQHAAETIDSVPRIVEAADDSLGQIEDHIKHEIAKDPNAVLNVNPIDNIRQALQGSKKISFMAEGLRALEDYPLGYQRAGGITDAPLTLQAADDIRWDMNQEMRSILNENKYDVANARATNPKFAALEAASQSLRDAVYGKLAQNGFSEAQALRLDEGSLIKYRNAAQNKIFAGDRNVPASVQPSIIRNAVAKGAKAATTAAGVGVGSAVGGPAGAAGGAILGSEVGDVVAGAVKPKPLTRNQLIERAFEHPESSTQSASPSANRAAKVTGTTTGPAAPTAIKPTAANATPQELTALAGAGATATAAGQQEKSSDESEEKAGTDEDWKPVSVTKTGGEDEKTDDVEKILQESAFKHGVDPNLIRAQAYQESKMDPTAVSKKGATGLMQLMPSVSKSLGIEDPTDAKQSAEGGTQLMSQLLHRFGREDYALAAYNWSPEKLQKVIDKFGNVEWINHVPAETRHYVRAIQANREAKTAQGPQSNYQQSSEFTPKASDVKEFETWTPTGPKTAPGMVKPGNIDLTKRPIVHRPSGEVSSLYSVSFGTDNGEVLVPLVSDDGKILTLDEAKKLYEKTGKSLGVFKTYQDADKYADYIHRKQGAFQTWKNGGKYNPSVETYSSN